MFSRKSNDIDHFIIYFPPMKAYQYAQIHQYRSPSPLPRHKKQYSISQSSKFLIAFFLVLSVLFVPIVLKRPRLLPMFFISSFLTIKFYQDADQEALIIAHQMKRRMSKNEIKNALLTPPSPDFDRRVRTKIITLMNN